jgi:hypothetical protein
MSKNILAGLRIEPTTEEIRDSLKIEQSVIGMAMGHLAELSYDITPTFQRVDGKGTIREAQAAQINSMSPTIQAVTWDMIVESSSKDHQMTQLVNLVRDGVPENKQSWPAEIAEYHRFKELAPQCYTQAEWWSQDP